MAIGSGKAVGHQHIALDPWRVAGQKHAAKHRSVSKTEGRPQHLREGIGLVFLVVGRGIGGQGELAVLGEACIGGKGLDDGLDPAHPGRLAVDVGNSRNGGDDLIVGACTHGHKDLAGAGEFQGLIGNEKAQLLHRGCLARLGLDLEEKFKAMGGP